MDTRHEQVQIELGQAATADRGIVELVRFARTRGAATVYSCEMDAGRAYIAFEDGASVQVFVDALASLARACQRWELLARITRTPAVAHPGILPVFSDCWSYEISLHGPVTRSSPTPLLFIVRISPDDVEAVTALVRLAAERPAPALPAN